MPFCTNDILALADTIYSDIGSPPAQSVGLISGWITTPINLGNLNSKLCTSFSISGACILGDFAAEEASIYSQMYVAGYYETKARQALDCGGAMWTRIAEGDSSVSRTSMTDISKQYMALHENARDELKLSIHAWKLRISVPQSVSAADLYSFPSP